MIPPRLWAVLTPDERVYLTALFRECEKEQSTEEFAETIKALLAVFLRDPGARVQLVVSASGEHDPEKDLRARLTPAENARLLLVIRRL